MRHVFTTAPHSDVAGCASGEGNRGRGSLGSAEILRVCIFGCLLRRMKT